MLPTQLQMVARVSRLALEHSACPTGGVVSASPFSAEICALGRNPFRVTATAFPGKPLTRKNKKNKNTTHTILGDAFTGARTKRGNQSARAGARERSSVKRAAQTRAPPQKAFLGKGFSGHFFPRAAEFLSRPWSSLEVSDVCCVFFLSLFLSLFLMLLTS